jgi:predicted HD superfamily hydrolase involved in NAD metabolism
MEEANKLALKYNVDTEKAKVAGLLHDCAKIKGDSSNNLLHAKEGSELAQVVYNINDFEVLDAIRYHTTGRRNMTMLEKVVFIADKIEPNRKYEGVEKLRSMAYLNIDDAIIKSIMDTIAYVRKRNLKLDSDSLETLEFLKEVKFDS